MRALPIVVVAACGPHHVGTPRAMAPPEGFCPALARDDYSLASWAVAAKLDSVGGYGAEAEPLLRWWLAVQPCVREVDDACVSTTRHPELFVRVTDDELLRVRLFMAGGAAVAPTDNPCTLRRHSKTKTIIFFD